MVISTRSISPARALRHECTQLSCFRVRRYDADDGFAATMTFMLIQPTSTVGTVPLGNFAEIRNYETSNNLNIHIYNCHS